MQEESSMGTSVRLPERFSGFAALHLRHSFKSSPEFSRPPVSVGLPAASWKHALRIIALRKGQYNSFYVNGFWAFEFETVNYNICLISRGANMSYLSILALGLALSMDAFAVSICKGLGSRHSGLKVALACGIWFGIFQALMTLIGFFAGQAFSVYIEAFDHWVAFGLLLLIGINMIREAFKDDASCEDADISPIAMLPLAVATSIDALAAGVSLAMASDVKIWVSVSIIGAITFILSIIGARFGVSFGAKFERNAQITGGIILILIGCKILFEHMLG